MCKRSYFVVQFIKNIIGIQIDYVFEPILILTAFLRYQTPCIKLFMGSRKIRDVNLNVVSVKGRNFAVDFAENKFLPFSNLYPRNHTPKIDGFRGC